MTTLLLRCVGPMQSWGTRSRFDERDTEREPSKSGIIGLLCAALGRDRNEPLTDLAALRMGVRVDREGRVANDYHTAQKIIEGATDFETTLSNRAYLADAAFLVGLEGDGELLRMVQAALETPVWPIFLGRKSFPPALPVRLDDGLRSESLGSALGGYPDIYPDITPAFKKIPGSAPNSRPPRRFVIECTPSESSDLRRDVPLSFAFGKRRFSSRRVRTYFEECHVSESTELQSS